jgi:hypothetical protein
MASFSFLSTKNLLSSLVTLAFFRSLLFCYASGSAELCPSRSSSVYSYQGRISSSGHFTFESFKCNGLSYTSSKLQKLNSLLSSSLIDKDLTCSAVDRVLTRPAVLDVYCDIIKGTRSYDEISIELCNFGMTAVGPIYSIFVDQKLAAMSCYANSVSDGSINAINSVVGRFPITGTTRAAAGGEEVDGTVCSAANRNLLVGFNGNGKICSLT